MDTNLNVTKVPRTPFLEVPAAPEVVNLFPDFREIDPAPDGSRRGVIAHDLGSTKMLRNLGYDVVSPIRLYYDFPHPVDKPPFDVQIRTCELLVENKRAYVLNDMGTGKTVCPVWSFDYLKGLKFVHRMLVVAPLSTLTFTWLREIFDFCPHLRAVVVYGSKKRRLELLAQEADIYIINHDGMLVIGNEIKARTDIDVVCMDELAFWRNPHDGTKFVQKYINDSKHIAFAWGMTGSPTPHLPTDVFNQAKILTPWTVPKYFGTFREQTMYKVSQFKWVPQQNANEIAFSALQPNVRFAMEDVTELPEYVSQRVDTTLGPKQKKIYEDVRKTAVAMVDGKQITAVNSAAAMNKLLQISLGWVYDDKHNVVQLDNAPRVASLTDILDAHRTTSDGKVIIFSAFKHALAGVEKIVAAAGYSVAVVSGDTPAGKRAEIFDDFQNRDKYDVLDAHPQCMAHGITLTVADLIVWFGPFATNEIYDQANRRIRRVGQKRKQLYLHLQATPQEKHLYGLLTTQQSTQHALMEMFRLAVDE